MDQNSNTRQTEFSAIIGYISARVCRLPERASDLSDRIVLHSGEFKSEYKTSVHTQREGDVHRTEEKKEIRM